MSEQNQLAVAQPRALLAVASLTGLDQKYLIATVKAQCFKGAATDEQVDAFISIACEMKVNPLLPGMLYAYPVSGGGIVPIMGPDGVYKKLTEHAEVDSWETDVFPTDVTQPPTHAVTKIHRKGRQNPLVYTAVLSEWAIASNPNWRTRPRHMLGLRSLKQCARQIIHGIPYDEDDREIMGLKNVTPEPVTDRPAPPAREPKGAKAAKENARKVASEVIVSPEGQSHTEPVEPKPAELVKQVQPVKQVEQESSKPVEAPKPAVVPRASLNPGETITVPCEVVAVRSMEMKAGPDTKPSVRVELKGGYLGKEILHFGGGQYVLEGGEKVRVGGEGSNAQDWKTVPAAPWAVGAKLNVTLFGKKLQNGEVRTYIQDAQPIGAVQPVGGAQEEEA